MQTLFSHPTAWVASTVGTRLRFWLNACVLPLFTGYAIYSAAHQGVRSATGIAIFVICMQFYLLYALRAMYLRVKEQERDPS